MLKMFYKSLNNEKGFTLIELIVVIAVLGILATVAIPRLGNFTDRAKISADKATFAAMQTAVAIAVADDRLPNGGDIIFNVAATTGVISATKDSAADGLIEEGAAFQVAKNKDADETLTWTVTKGAITAAPTIDSSTGEIDFD